MRNRLDRASTKVVKVARDYKKYLSRYGESEASHYPEPPTTAKFVLVIPAYQEELGQIEETFTGLKDLLIILVVNSSEPLEKTTQGLLFDIDQCWQLLNEKRHMRWYETPSQHYVLVVDRCAHPIDRKQGVGKARKIGADIALRLIETGSVREPWIFNTDADADLPRNYLNSFQDEPSIAFQLFPFKHGIEDDLAAALYEFSLLWYPLGLKFAGSSFAFPSVGSTITCSADAYAKVRGFPPRSAGEDFYLLNKLRKVGSFLFVNSDPIGLSSRRSDRVPFGTGPGLRKIDQLAESLSFPFYHPNVFGELKIFIDKLKTSQDAENLAKHFDGSLMEEFVLTSQLLPLLDGQKSQTPKQYQKFIQDWFDGFRTLKFIHLARDQAYKSVQFPDIWRSEILPFDCPGTSASSVEQGTQLAWKALI